MNRSELLAQWAELAPGECFEEIPHWGGPSTWAFKNRTCRTGSDRTYFPALVLYVLIEAIRARKWALELTVSLGIGTVFARVSPKYDVAVEREAEETEPCDALLAAYVAALRATAAVALSAGKE